MDEKTFFMHGAAFKQKMHPFFILKTGEGNFSLRMQNALFLKINKKQFFIWQIKRGLNRPNIETPPTAEVLILFQNHILM